MTEFMIVSIGIFIFAVGVALGIFIGWVVLNG